MTAILTLVLTNDNIKGPEAGFLLTFMSGIVMNVGWLIYRVRDFAVRGVTLERLAEYKNLEQEDDMPWNCNDASQTHPEGTSSWPKQGKIEVTNLCASYGPGMPDILHGVGFSVAAGERVGIVGASGGGKSTLAKTFFRFVDITNGTIKIDGEGKYCCCADHYLLLTVQILLNFPSEWSGPILASLLRTQPF